MSVIALLFCVVVAVVAIEACGTARVAEFERLLLEIEAEQSAAERIVSEIEAETASEIWAERLVSELEAEIWTEREAERSWAILTGCDPRLA